MRKKTFVLKLSSAILISTFLLNCPVAYCAATTQASSTLSPAISIDKLRSKNFFDLLLSTDFCEIIAPRTHLDTRTNFNLKIDGKRSFKIPFPFPSAQYNRGQLNPEWLESYILARHLLNLSFEYGQNIPLGKIYETAPITFKKYGFEVQTAQLMPLLNGLRQRGLLRNSADSDFTLNPKETVSLDVPLRIMAIWSDAFNYIFADIKYALESGRHEFLSTMEEYARGSELWPDYPVESKYPVLRAIANLSADDQKKIVTLLSSNERLRSIPLIDSILLMLDFEKTQKEWLQKNAPHLIDRRIYLVAAEISLLAGGLGRVMQYHGTNMHKLGAEVIYTEPYYRQTRNKQGEAVSLDYSKIAIPVQNLKKIRHNFNTIVQEQNVEFEVFFGKNAFGIQVYLIRDTAGKFVNILYEYGTQESPASNYEFTEFFTKATLELIRYLEIKKLKKSGNEYRAPLVDANDGQALPLNAFRRVFYSDKNKILKNDASDEEINQTFEILNQAIFNGTTHTYRNRGIVGDFNYGRQFLTKAGIPEEYLWLFLRKEIDGHLLWDLTSGGLRSSDTAKAVSAIHAYEMNARDPLIRLVGITNGDDRAYSSEFFRQALQEIGATDMEHPTPKQVAKAKVICKKNIGLDPNQLVVSYSGRLVQEKAGRDRAFTDENIEALVKEGIQVVIYGNVQPYDESIRIKDSLERLQERLNHSGYPGRFIFKPKFDIDEQRHLLAATDVQIQDSDRYTGASEYTEADVTANGGLQMGAPFWEGIIQRQGAVVNLDLGTGNTLVPVNTDRGSFLARLKWANAQFIAPDNKLSIFQAQSVKLSRVLEASLTAAEYLRFWDKAFWRKSNTMPAPKPRVAGEVEVLDISMNYHTANGVKKASREGNIFHLEYSPAEIEELEFSVTVDRRAFDTLHYGHKNLVPFDMISVDLVNEYGIRIPLSVKKVEDGTSIFHVFIPRDLPLPFQGTIEVTSGVWKIAHTITINTDRILERKNATDFAVNAIEQSI